MIIAWCSFWGQPLAFPGVTHGGSKASLFVSRCPRAPEGPREKKLAPKVWRTYSRLSFPLEDVAGSISDLEDKVPGSAAGWVSGCFPASQMYALCSSRRGRFLVLREARHLFSSHRAFYRDLTLRQLREALARWRRKSRVLNPLRLTEVSLLVLADLQESSLSSSALPSAGQVCVARGCGLGELAASPSWPSSQNLVNKRRKLSSKIFTSLAKGWPSGLRVCSFGPGGRWFNW